jgi:hypothetical protein
LRIENCTKKTARKEDLTMRRLTYGEMIDRSSRFLGYSMILLFTSGLVLGLGMMLLDIPGWLMGGRVLIALAILCAVLAATCYGVALRLRRQIK